MTLEEWNLHPEYAAELAKVLNSPIIKAAREIVEGMTMAKSMNGSSLLRVAMQGQTLFGYDVGRGSVFKDLDDMAKVPETPQPLSPGYAAKPETNEQIVRTFPEKKKSK